MITNSHKKPRKFLALNFETTNYYRDSACAVGIIRVEDNKIIAKRSYLIKSPSSWLVFSDLLRIAWNDVKNKLTFDELLPQLKKYFIGLDFIAALNAPFDRSGLVNCCERYGVCPPNRPFE